MEPCKVTSTDIKRALAEKHWRDFFLTEVKSGSSWMTARGDMKILDALAIRKSWTSPRFTGYEVKISRSDFLRDAKFYTYEELCNCLYLVCPKGMIQRTEIPESVGLMYYDPDKKTIITKKKAIYRKIEYSPDMLLYIIYSRLDSDRYPFFSEKQAYFQAYLDGKRDHRELGRLVKTKLVEENARMERELEHLQYFKQDLDRYRAIGKVLDKHHIYDWPRGIAEELDRALSRKCPEDLSSIRETLEGVVRRLERMEKTEKGENDHETDPV